MSSPHKRYIPSLDGLRAFAVLAVIAYHLRFEWSAGGLLGVTIFFVLSGYLITNLLLIEWEQTKRINLKQFWIRRARRLLPAMLVMLLVITAWVTLFDQAFLAKLRDDFLPAVLYISNWWYIFQDLSYFESMGVPSLLTHFWSLAVEEQFYIVWPLFIFIALSIKLKKKPLMMIILILAIASAVAMAWMYEPGVDPSRIYYGTDTRAFSLLIGAVLAFVWPSHKLSRSIPAKLRVSLDLVGLLSIGGLAIMIHKSSEYTGFLYLGGMVLASLLTAILIAVLVHPSSMLSSCLGMKPLRWIGVRSYGIYLWHYPIILLTNPLVNTEEPSVWHIMFQVSLTFVIAGLSYTYIENPIRKGWIRQFIGKIRSGQWKIKRLSTSRWMTIGCGALLLFISTIGLAAAPIEQASGTESKKPLEIIVENNKQEQTEASIKYNKEGQEKQEEPSGAQDNQTNATQTNERKVTVIGDSVFIDVAPFLKEKFPNVLIDAKVGRQMSTAREIYQQFQQSGKVGEIIVIALGSNGAFSKAQLEELIATIGEDKKIYLVNTRVPKPWESVVNQTLQEAAAKYSNTTLVDWHKSSAGHNEYLGSDGVHLTQTGARAYAALLEQVIK